MLHSVAIAIYVNSKFRNTMIINLDEQCSIFFGDASTCPVSHRDEVQFKNFCDGVRQQFGLQKLVVQHQTHGIDGLYIDDINQITDPVMYKEREGDYLITNQPGVGIGVITADCLPIIFYVSEHKLVAAAHAGWKGSVAGIGVKVLQEIMQKHNLELSRVQVYFGPAARSCCYEVQQDFLVNIPSSDQNVITNRDGKYYFDNLLFNKQQLIKYGILSENIHDQYNLCTICNHQFHSCRRDKEKFKTQLTVIWLH